MAQPTVGPAVLAWKISQYPQYWIPLILIVIGVAVGVYLLIPAMIEDPMPKPSEVTEMYMSWDPTGKEESFKKIPHEQYYYSMCQSCQGGFASKKTPGKDLIATVRVKTRDDKVTTFKFFDSDLMTINGKCYDRARFQMFLQEAEGTRYGY
jgi:hypothetical protein